MASSSPGDVCQFCVLAKFYTNRGAVLEHSVPPHTGLDEHTLAQQMMPDGMHDVHEDWVVLIRPVASLALANVPERPAHVQSKVPHAHAQAHASEEGDSIYILSLARTIRDASEPRGACMAALALGTMHPQLSMFKPALVLALNDYFATRNVDVVRRLFLAMNTLHLAHLPCPSYSEKMRMRSDSVLHALYRTSTGGMLMHACATLYGGGHAMPRTTQRKRHSLTSVRRSRVRHSISSPQQTCSYAPFYYTCVHYGTTCIPVHVPLHVFPEEVGEYSLTLLISTFGHAKMVGAHHAHLHSNGIYTPPLTILFNALVTHKRVLFVAYHAPAEVVVQHVLAACAFASGCGAVLRSFLSTAIPYATLANVETLQSMRGFIVGTRQPRLEEMGLWDVLCHCEMRTITISSSMKAAPSFSSPVSTRASTRRLLRAATRSVHEASVGDERSNAPDVLFMHHLVSVTEQHASEPFVRHWCQAYVREFVALATRYEQAFYGTSLLQPVTNAHSEMHDMYTLRCHAPRIEAWRSSPSYRSLLWDMSILFGDASRATASFCFAPCGTSR